MPLTENHMEFLSLKGGCTGSSESTLVRMSHSWKANVAARLFLFTVIVFLMKFTQIDVLGEDRDFDRSFKVSYHAVKFYLSYCVGLNSLLLRV